MDLNLDILIKLLNYFRLWKKYCCIWERTFIFDLSSSNIKSGICIGELLPFGRDIFGQQVTKVKKFNRVQISQTAPKKSYTRQMEGNKMKLFQTNKLVMRWYSLYPPAEGTGRAKKLAYLAVSAVVFFINFAGMLSTSLFAFKHISIDFEESLYAILPAAALFKISYMSVVAYTIRPQIVGLIEKYSDYYKSCEKFNDVIINCIPLKHKFEFPIRRKRSQNGIFFGRRKWT